MTDEEMIAQGFITPSPATALAVPRLSEFDVQIAKIQTEANERIQMAQANIAVAMRAIDAKLRMPLMVPELTAMAMEAGHMQYRTLFDAERVIKPDGEYVERVEMRWSPRDYFEGQAAMMRARAEELRAAESYNRGVPKHLRR